MLKLITILIVNLAIHADAIGQLYQGKKGHVKFFSDAPLEDIEAISSETISALNMATGEIAVLIPIKSFVFDKALMQEHFNQTYLESDKFPESTFVGKLDEKISDDAAKDKPLNVFGKLTVHGVTREAKIQVALKLSADGFLNASGKFMIKLADHKIKIPKLVFKNIAEVVEVTFDLKLKRTEQ